MPILDQAAGYICGKDMYEYRVRYRLSIDSDTADRDYRIVRQMNEGLRQMRLSKSQAYNLGYEVVNVFIYELRMIDVGL